MFAQPTEGRIESRFNIMPGLEVREQFTIRRIEANDTSAYALFDRAYFSGMRNSPDHITMTTLPLLAQRVFYAWCCRRLGLTYDPDKPELLKVWPIRMSFDYPKLVRFRRNVRYEMTVLAFNEIEGGRYFVKGTGSIAGKIRIDAEGVVIPCS